MRPRVRFLLSIGIFSLFSCGGGGGSGENVSRSASWPFDNPQYLLLNLAIGSDMGGTVDNSIFPVQMEVDYVRVYQKL
ncbi:glycoside hydrolase family 16 protein [Duganella hordei]|uniref:glycoside hydrolase family 16 protein n=1 Tax=Duganella hordei TaxID=2865934 RepID=UPI0030E8B8FC